MPCAHSPSSVIPAPCGEWLSGLLEWIGREGFAWEVGLGLMAMQEYYQKQRKRGYHCVSLGQYCSMQTHIMIIKHTTLIAKYWHNIARFVLHSYGNAQSIHRSRGGNWSTWPHGCPMPYINSTKMWTKNVDLCQRLSSKVHQSGTANAQKTVELPTKL